MAERLGNNVPLSRQRAARARAFSAVATRPNKNVEEIKFYHEQCVKGSARILNLNIRLDISLKCYTRVKANNTGLKYRDVRNAAKPV